MYARATKVKKPLVSTLHLEKWSIIFDGKHIGSQKRSKINLVDCTQIERWQSSYNRRRTSESVGEIQSEGSIVVIVADKISVNTDKKTGAVVRLHQTQVHQLPAP
jgi:hypothetical protein